MSQQARHGVQDSFSLNGRRLEAQNCWPGRPEASGDREQSWCGQFRQLTDATVRAQTRRCCSRRRLPDVARSLAVRAHGAAQISRLADCFANVTMTKQAPSHDSQAKEFVSTASGRGPVWRSSRGPVAELANRTNVSSSASPAAALVVLFLCSRCCRAPAVAARHRARHGTAVIGLLSHVLTCSFSSQLRVIGLASAWTTPSSSSPASARTQRGSVEQRSSTRSIRPGAVMFAGITVCIALLGMFALGVASSTASLSPRACRALHRARCAHAAAALLGFLGRASSPARPARARAAS